MMDDALQSSLKAMIPDATPTEPAYYTGDLSYSANYSRALSYKEIRYLAYIAFRIPKREHWILRFWRWLRRRL